MAKKKAQIDEIEVQVTEVSAPEPAAAYTEAHCHTGDGQLNRVFSKDIHGEQFAELAREFSEPRGMEIRLR